MDQCSNLATAVRRHDHPSVGGQIQLGVSSFIEADCGCSFAFVYLEFSCQFQHLQLPSAFNGFPDCLPTQANCLLSDKHTCLLQELERALSKHEIIGVKSIAQQSSKSSSAHVSESQMKKAVGDLQRSIRDTEKEISCTEVRAAAA